MSAVTPEEILSAHRAGLPPSRIASSLGVPLRLVRKTILASWAEGAARQPRTDDGEAAAMMARHEGGMTWAEVGVLFGVTGDTARQRVAAWRKRRRDA